MMTALRYNSCIKRTNLNIKQQILWLDVPMNDLLLVTVRQCSSKARDVLKMQGSMPSESNKRMANQKEACICISCSRTCYGNASTFSWPLMALSKAATFINMMYFHIVSCVNVQVKGSKLLGALCVVSVCGELYSSFICKNRIDHLPCIVEFLKIHYVAVREQ